MFLAGVVLMILVLMRRAGRYRRKLRQGSQVPGQTGAKPADGTREPLLDAPADILRWQVEMHEMAREIKAEVDTKLALLQVLVGMARKESDRLEAALAHAQGGGIAPAVENSPPGATMDHRAGGGLG